MTITHPPVVLTSSSIGGRDEEVVEANAAIIDAMRKAMLRLEDMSPVAVRSCLVDFYLSQALEGGFAQYAVMAGGRIATDPLVREGMAGMGATAHLDLFNRAVEAYGVLSAGIPASYLVTGGGDGGAGDSGAVPGAVLRVEELDGEFEELLEHENITALNARWLRGQPDLLVLDDEEVGPYIQRLAAAALEDAGMSPARRTAHTL
ncbi:DMP19 family protein [Pseudarthrobacter sp. alpha12b]